MKKKIAVIFALLILITQKTYSLEKTKLYENNKNNIENILLIGKDNTNSNLTSRSDCMIILTINTVDKALKLTSLARDTLVDIPGVGEEKLNHAYAYGKEELLLETINKNFKLDIKDYVVVDFRSFIEIVDIIGGVDVEINEKELKDLNNVIKVCYSLDSSNGGNIQYIDNVGSNKLNGYQTLAYARIRKMDTIYRRDERQRKILANIATKLSDISVTEYPRVISSIINHINANISIDKIFKLAFISQNLANYKINQLEFPISKYREEGRIGKNNTYVVKWDKEINLKELHDFINNK